MHIYGVQGDMIRPCSCCGHALGRLLFLRRTFKMGLISRQSVIVPALKQRLYLAPTLIPPRPPSSPDSSLLIYPS